MVTFGQMTTEKFRFVALGILHTITPSRTRFQSRSGWVFAVEGQKPSKKHKMDGFRSRNSCAKSRKSPRYKGFFAGVGCKKEGP